MRAAPDMSVSTRSILQALLTMMLEPLGRAIQQDLAKVAGGSTCC